MTDQKDLFNADGQQGEKITAEESLSPANKVEDEASEAVEDIAGRGVAAGEVRAVEPSQQKSATPLVAVLLILLILFAGGYYLLNGGLGISQTADSGQGMVEPKRYTIEKNVTVEVVEQNQVAAVATLEQPVEKVAAVKLEQENLPPVNKTVAPTVVEKKIAPATALKPQYQVLVGPFLQTALLEAATQKLKQLGLQAEVARGRGPVAMTRLLEGVYLREEGRERVKAIKQQVGDAFLLPSGDKLALYVGSFTDPQRAQQYADQLAEKGVVVTPVTIDVEMNGKMLIAMQGEQAAARAVAAQVDAVGLSAQVKKQ